MTLVQMHVKWSATLTDRLVPEILTVLEIIKGTSFASDAFTCEGSWLAVKLKCALTKKLPKLLSRLNEMSDGRENMCLV